MNNHEYLLVYAQEEPVNSKPIALLRAHGRKRKVIAGDTRASLKLPHESIGKRAAYEPVIGELIDEIGPAHDGVQRRLELSRRKSRARSVVVTPADVFRMKQLYGRGMSYEKVAKRTGFGRSTVERYIKGLRVAGTQPLPDGVGASPPTRET